MANYAALIQSLAISGSRKSDGTANASGKVWAYLPDTSTTVNLYADAAATVIVTQPIILDAGGRIPQADYPDGVFTKQAVRLLVQDSTGGTTVSDSVFVPSTAGATGYNPSQTNAAFTRTNLNDILQDAGISFGGHDWNYLISTGQTELKVKDAITAIAVNVKSFGAKGDGLQTDTTAIQSAINYAVSLGGGVVYFPPTSAYYKIDQLLSVGGSNIIFRGGGAGASIIKQTGAFGIFSASTKSNLLFEDIQLTHSSTSTAAAVLLTNVSNVAFSRCTISNFLISIDTTNSTASNRRLMVTACDLTYTNSGSGRGIRIDGTTTTGALSVLGGAINAGGASTGRGIEILGTQNGAIIGGVFFNNPAAAVAFGASSAPVAIAAIGCHVLGGTVLTSALTVPTGNMVFAGIGNTTGTVSDASSGQDMVLLSSDVAGRPPLDKTVASGGTLAPGNTDGFASHYNITANGNITISTSPTTSSPVSFTIKNNTAGGITVTMAAVYKTTAAVAPAAGAFIALRFVPGPDGNMHEASRATT